MYSSTFFINVRVAPNVRCFDYVLMEMFDYVGEEIPSFMELAKLEIFTSEESVTADKQRNVKSSFLEQSWPMAV